MRETRCMSLLPRTTLHSDSEHLCPIRMRTVGVYPSTLLCWFIFLGLCNLQTVAGCCARADNGCCSSAGHFFNRQTTYRLHIFRYSCFIFGLQGNWSFLCKNTLPGVTLQESQVTNSPLVSVKTQWNIHELSPPLQIYLFHRYMWPSCSVAKGSLQSESSTLLYYMQHSSVLVTVRDSATFGFLDQCLFCLPT